MSEARRSLPPLSALAELLRRKAPLPSPPHCLRQAAQLFRHEAAQQPPERRLLEDLRATLGQACATGAVDQLRQRDLRWAPLVFWNGVPQAATLPALLDTVFDGARTKPRWLREVVEAWLRDFAPEAPRLPEAGARIVHLLALEDHAPLSQWRHAHRRFSLFDAAHGPARLAAALLGDAAGLPQVLHESGMDDPLRVEGRFFQAVLAAMLEALPLALRGAKADQAWSRAATILEHKETGRLRAPQLIGRVIDACLAPWTSGGGTTVPRHAIQAFLVRTIGDPRLRPERWKAAREDSVRVVRAWLAEAMLESFFQLISDTNRDTRWPYRKAFWHACIRGLPRGQEAEVWVVLGPAIGHHARALQGLAGAFGEMKATGQYANQAVLLIQIGNLVIGEWSDVGKIRAWTRDDANAPRLYMQTQYSADRLRAPGLAFTGDDRSGLSHTGAETGVWQSRAAAFLHSHTGLKLTPADYMPR